MTVEQPPVDPFKYPDLSLAKMIPDITSAPKSAEESHRSFPLVTQLITGVFNPEYLQDPDREQKVRRVARLMATSGDAFYTGSRLVADLEKKLTNQSDKKALNALNMDIMRYLENEVVNSPTGPDIKAITNYLILAITDDNKEMVVFGRKMLRCCIERTEKAAKQKESRTDKQKPIIDFLYDLSLASLNLNSTQAEKLLVQILSFSPETASILRSGDMAAKRFISASFSMSDEILAKYFDLDHIGFLLRRIYEAKIPDLEKSYGSAYDLIKNDAYAARYMEEVFTSDSRRAQQISDYYLNEGKGFLRASNPTQAQDKNDADLEVILREEDFPLSLFLKVRPLSLLYFKKLVEGIVGAGDQAAIVFLPDGAAKMMVLDRISETEIIQPGETNTVTRRMLLKAYQGGNGRIIEHKETADQALEMLRPTEINDETVEGLLAINEKAEKDLQEASCTLSPRGDLVQISDPRLKSLCLSEILCRMGDGLETDITLTVGGYKIELTLNYDGHLLYRDGSSLVISNDARLWWETVAMVHMRDLLCRSEKVNIIMKGQGLSNQREAIEREKEFTSRRGHLRRLPPGQKFTEEQRQAYLEYSDGSRDLKDINEKLGRTKDTGMITFVFPVEQVTMGKKDPVVSRIPTAMREVNKIIDEQDKKD